MQLKTIKVYGRLRKFLGSSYFEAAVSSPAEAIRFLVYNFPEVEKHMSQRFYKIKMNNTNVDLDFLSVKGKGDIQIIPIATGSLPAVAAVFGGIASGAAAVATAVSAVPVIGGVASAAVGAVGAVAGGVATVAAAIPTIPVIGGIASAVVNTVAIEGVTSLIAPTPEIIPPPIIESTGADPIPQNDVVIPDQRAQNSFGFSAITNISRAGVAVPIIYGEVFTGSVVISAGIDTVQIEGTAA
jgi:predicted phage tail protein